MERQQNLHSLSCPWLCCSVTKNKRPMQNLWFIQFKKWFCHCLLVLPPGHTVPELRNGTAHSINYANKRNLAGRLRVYIFKINGIFIKFLLLSFKIFKSKSQITIKKG